MPVILLVLVGAAAGYVAARIMRVNVDMPTAMVVGVIGAVLGGMAFRFLMASAGWVVMFVIALLASMGLIWAWQKYQGRR